ASQPAELRHIPAGRLRLAEIPVRCDAMSHTRRELLIGVVEHLQGQPHLLEVVQALGAVGRLAHLLDGGEEQPDEHRDDANDHQQLDQRKSHSMTCSGHRSGSSDLQLPAYRSPWLRATAFIYSLRVAVASCSQLLEKRLEVFALSQRSQVAIFAHAP